MRTPRYPPKTTKARKQLRTISTRRVGSERRALKR
jgi:hypothetical protein